MWEFNEVIDIKYRGKYVYGIKFDDGIEGDIDFSEYLSRGPVFQSIKDDKVFSKATVEGGTISWPTGADIAPETLYEKLLSAHKPAHQTHKKAARR